MSPIDFASLASQHPEFAKTLFFLQTWLTSHPDVRRVQLTRLARADAQITPYQLNRSIEILLDAGRLQERFGVEDSDGTLLDGLFDSPDEIPPFVADRLGEHYIPTSEVDVVPVYVLAGDENVGH